MFGTLLTRLQRQSLKSDCKVDEYESIACTIMGIIEMLLAHRENPPDKCDEHRREEAIQLFQAGVEYLKNQDADRFSGFLVGTEDEEIPGMASFVMLVYFIAFPDRMALGIQNLITTIEGYVEILQKIATMDVGSPLTEQETRALQEIHAFFDVIQRESARRDYCEVCGEVVPNRANNEDCLRFA